ncbi:MAG: hypothetical protein ABJB22_01990, partial [Verrucomicrobiota bacterium]
AAQAFRYAHNLITAEETEHWLEERGLTLEDFSDYFIRTYWRNALDGKVTEKPIAFRSASPELRELLTAELFFSGEFERMTRRQSWQVAASCAAAGNDLPGDVIEAEEQRFFAREGIGPDELPGLLDQLDRDQSWFAEMISLQVIYRRQAETLLSGAAPNNELATLRLPLTRFELEIVEMESRDAAAEALFCVREDGMSMEEVAAENGYPYRRTTTLLEDIPVDSQQKFLSVPPGEVLDPIARGDGFQLCRVMGKSEPTLDDAVVRMRIEERILERHFSELAAKRIEWTSLMPIE